MTFEHESSTQYQQWTFTRKSLEETRIASHDVNIATVREAIKRESQLANISTPSPEFITYAHQLELCAFFESRFIEYCKLFKFDTTILGTAIIFFKRFYISASLMDHDPKIILLTCLYISSKVENLKMPLEDFLSKIPKAPLPQVILASEITVSNHLKFHFKIHHPFWPLHGYFLDLQVFFI